MSFYALAEIVGRPLPPSASRRQWWANNSSSQALAWRAAGFHVDHVDVDRKEVVFARGRVGGTYADRGRVPAGAPARVTPPTVAAPPQAPTVRSPVGDPVDVRVTLTWLGVGSVVLDATGKPVFAGLEAVPGLYRFTLTLGAADRPRVYIGETDNLRRRLAGNYRNPGPSQQTSLRVNAVLREHLGAGGRVALAMATSASAWLNGEKQALDLTRKAARLLAENAALVLAQAATEADIINLG